MGYCQASPSAYVCVEVKQREIIASLGEGEKLFNRGAHGGKAISNNVLFLQQQLCLTPVASTAHYSSSHLFLPHRLHAFPYTGNSNESMVHGCIVCTGFGTAPGTGATKEVLISNETELNITGKFEFYIFIFKMRQNNTMKLKL